MLVLLLMYKNEFFIISNIRQNEQFSIENARFVCFLINFNQKLLKNEVFNQKPRCKNKRINPWLSPCD
ncbi:hypothetical protein BTO15_06690 [Polaribacter sejongensis]|uniref:Uncharacterized protein n=1 Tax=Polaribacter sejongensis TaxID=985043 RepID=A0ABM6PYE2_9FLAO|nr:hypothetical protein BTO15_06690 [Polaribacter sejongensis]